MSERECGGCGECCFALAIEDVGKPKMTQCQYFCEGCSIYETRPKSCADWNCLWLKGHLPLSQRPDRSKTVFWLPDEETASRWGGRLVMAAESRSSASRMPATEKSIRRLFKGGNNLMVIDTMGGRTLHLHREFIARVIVDSKKNGVVPKVNGHKVIFTPEDAEAIWPGSQKQKDGNSETSTDLPPSEAGSPGQ
jgi:hypothetical protein